MNILNHILNLPFNEFVIAFNAQGFNNHGLTKAQMEIMKGLYFKAFPGRDSKIPNELIKLKEINMETLREFAMRFCPHSKIEFIKKVRGAIFDDTATAEKFRLLPQLARKIQPDLQSPSGYHIGLAEAKHFMDEVYS